MSSARIDSKCLIVDPGSNGHARAIFSICQSFISIGHSQIVSGPQPVRSSGL